MPIHPHQLKTDLSRAYGTHYAAVLEFAQRRMMGWVCTEVLDEIDTRARANHASRIGVLHRRLIDLLLNKELVESEPLREEFTKLYREAEQIVFPAATAFVGHSQALQAWTRNWSLARIDLNRLRGIDLKAHEDPTFKEYVGEMLTKLPELAAAPSVQAYSQFFEVYSEALVLEFLRTKVRTARVPRASKGTPDFRCQLDDAREFYVEVKTLDIVGGQIRHDEIMLDAIDQAVDLDRQLAEGRSVAVAEGEIAPYRRSSETATYDPRSLIRVIDTLREKWVQAFKADQFRLGPTLALAVTDRLGAQARPCELVPYYINDAPSLACISGVLWHAAFGMPGTPVFRPPVSRVRRTWRAILLHRASSAMPGVLFPAPR